MLAASRPERYHDLALRKAPVYYSTMLAKPVFTSPVTAIREIVCDAARGGCGDVERSELASIAIPLRGCYAVERNGHAVVADANTAIFFEANGPYRVEHPAEEGDVTFAITCDESTASDALDGSHPTHAALTPALQLKVRSLRRRIRSKDDPLAIEEEALAIVAGVTRAPTHLSQRRVAAVERAKAFLGARFRDRVLLSEVATVSGISPFSLARAFPAATGMTVHSYLTALRHAAALDAIAGGEADLARVAVDCGFSHHSHFTKTFVRVFGSTPSAVRARISE
jgi:AraC family transcriptional regulator